MGIQGKVVVFTGKISKPRHEFQQMVEEHGGIAGSDVTSKTDYLVVGEKPGSKLFRAASLGIKTISEDEFLKLLEEDEQATPKPEFIDYCGTGTLRHHWFRKTVKEDGDVVKDCLCGAVMITHPNGIWEKHEPRHVIEQARRIAHAHAVKANQDAYKRQEIKRKAEKSVIEQLENLSEEEIKQLERQLND